MPEWATFVGFTFVVTAGLLVLSYASQGALTDPTSDAATDHDTEAAAHDAESTDGTTSDQGPGVEPESGGGVHTREQSEAIADTPGIDAKPEVATGIDSTDDTVVLPKSGVAYRAEPTATDDDEPPSTLTTPSLLANVAVSQGLFGALLLFGAWYAEIPAQAFGIGAGVTGGRAVAIGVGLGVALYAANEVSAAVGARLGLEVGDGQRLRGALAPETLGGWILLLLVVLPVIAGFEEVLFRGALVGVVSSGYGVSAWVMAVVASGAFALGHGAQGRLGVLVTGALGFVLAAAFVLTGSLVVVIVAHYLVNALEFVVHEGLRVEWPPEEAES